MNARPSSTQLTLFSLTTHAAETIYELVTEGKANLIPEDISEFFNSRWCTTELLANATDLGNTTLTNATELFNFVSQKINYNATLFQVSGPGDEAVEYCMRKSVHDFMKDLEPASLLSKFAMGGIVVGIFLACAVIAYVCNQLCKRRAADEQIPLLPMTNDHACRLN